MGNRGTDACRHAFLGKAAVVAGMVSAFGCIDTDVLGGNVYIAVGRQVAASLGVVSAGGDSGMAATAADDTADDTADTGYGC